MPRVPTVVLGRRPHLFDFTDMLVSMSQPKKDWNPQERPKNTHLGQPKLLLGELAFLMEYQDNLSGRKVVYPGAAAGHHWRAIDYLFGEQLEVHLYDPAPFILTPTDRIHIYGDLFTDELADYWANEKNVLFISDIRSGNGASRKGFEDEVHKNMMMQQGWVRTIKPEAFSLKFRIPYNIIERAEPYVYLNGMLVKQAFPKVDSMELRLWGGHIDAAAEPISYDSSALEKIMFYHNSEIRPKKKYANVITGDTSNYPADSGYYRDYDSTYFLFLVSTYLNKFPGRVAERGVVELANKLLSLTYGPKFNLKQRRNVDG